MALLEQSRLDRNTIERAEWMVSETTGVIVSCNSLSMPAICLQKYRAYFDLTVFALFRDFRDDAAFCKLKHAHLRLSPEESLAATNHPCSRATLYRRCVQYSAAMEDVETKRAR